MSRNFSPVVQVHDEILSLFRPEDEHLLPTDDGTVYGREDIVGLRLIGNCVHDAILGDSQDVKCPATDKVALGCLARIKEVIRQYGNTLADNWVLCYHVQSTGQWCMAWSGGHTFRSATAELLRYMHCGIGFIEDEE